MIWSTTPVVGPEIPQEVVRMVVVLPDFTNIVSVTVVVVVAAPVVSSAVIIAAPNITVSIRTTATRMLWRNPNSGEDPVVQKELAG